MSVFSIDIFLSLIIIYFSLRLSSPNPIESVGVGLGFLLLYTLIPLLSTLISIVSVFFEDIMLCLHAFSISICTDVGIIYLCIDICAGISGKFIDNPSPCRIFIMSEYCLQNAISSDNITKSLFSFISKYR